MLFVGDSMYPEGNDYAPFAHGIRSRPVRDEDETLKFLHTILRDPEGYFDNKFYKKFTPETITEDLTHKGVYMKSKKPQPLYALHKQRAFNKEKIDFKSEYTKKINVFFRHFMVHRGGIPV